MPFSVSMQHICKIPRSERPSPIFAIVEVFASPSALVPVRKQIKIGQSLGWYLKNELPCHSKCGTTKNPPCSIPARAGHRPEFCSPSQQWWRLHSRSGFHPPTHPSSPSRYVRNIYWRWNLCRIRTCSVQCDPHPVALFVDHSPFVFDHSTENQVADFDFYSLSNIDILIKHHFWYNASVSCWLYGAYVILIPSVCVSRRLFCHAQSPKSPQLNKYRSMFMRNIFITK